MKYKISERLRVYLFTVVPWSVGGILITAGIVMVIEGSIYGWIIMLVSLSSCYNLWKLDAERGYYEAIYQHHLRRKADANSQLQDRK